MITREEARMDVEYYLEDQTDEYFSERKTTKEEVLADNNLLERLADEHMRCVNRFGNDRDWSAKDACDSDPGIYRTDGIK